MFIESIKSYINIALIGIGALFTGWVYFLKKQNDAKTEEIRELNSELKVQKAEAKEQVKVSEFVGTKKVLDAELEKSKNSFEKAFEEAEKGRKEYEIRKNIKESSTINPVGPTSFTFV